MSSDTVSLVPSPVVSANGIFKSFGGVPALVDVSIDLIPGEVHCLAGENGCGKSTLIKIISGVERPDSGEILIDGVSHSHINANAAIKSGIQVIYQDFSLFPNLTVAENIVLTAEVARRRRLYSPASVRPKAEEILRDLGLDLDLDREVSELSVADKQLTAICRALVNDARAIIMDEPTTALTHSEVSRLFALVERLRARGVALMFVSHKLEEVLAISQRLTIMRSGRQIVTGPTTDFDERSISHYMTGREVDESRVVSELDATAPLALELVDLSLAGAYRNISFGLRRGEILGVTGLLGSGRTEIAESLFGVTPADEGQIKVNGAPVRIRSIQDAVSAGIGYVPEDRLSQGLFLEKSIADNIVASSLRSHRTRWGTLSRDAIASTIKHYFHGLKINARNAQAPVRTLSGGNAQRVVLAKWLATSPTVLLLNGPTVGVDVGSKQEILELLRVEAAKGMSVIVISDDAPELVSSCHRVLVIKQGRLTHILEGDEITVDTIQERMSA
ncbi:sugar ABC transporter ATP-binding protein [Mycetocola miduiensis]|uniref:Monosaccharide ABC transporter ATP-binding protein, CUT2 family n=1 Tax=Mycetocola miduiensis TaxID=995034 RepID=A0A1I5C510_9MICO|nr:sugar ABC transporter ATP-binding protein [Mycetocola miduiensis]SFN82160.1 monosaccharide ABC transporter ATP-binding protein, CUT2 family [Mycetocola miduiensis]